MTEKAAQDMDTSDLRARIVALEQWRVQKDIDTARHDERWKNMDEKIESVGKKVDKISGDLSRVMWIILSGIILAIIAFMLKGGFSP